MGVFISSGLHWHCHLNSNHPLCPLSRQWPRPKVFPKILSVLRLLPWPKYFPILFYWTFTYTKPFPWYCSKLDHAQPFSCLKYYPFNNLVNPQNFNPTFNSVPCIIERLRNHRPTLVLPSDVSSSVKKIWIGDVLLLEIFLVKFLPTHKPFPRKDALGWVWGFFIYLFVGSFDDPEQVGELSFQKLDAIESRDFIMSSWCSC